jgi:hypothetical protein
LRNVLDYQAIWDADDTLVINQVARFGANAGPAVSILHQATALGQEMEARVSAAEVKRVFSSNNRAMQGILFLGQGVGKSRTDSGPPDPVSARVMAYHPIAGQQPASSDFAVI